MATEADRRPRSRRGEGEQLREVLIDAAAELMLELGSAEKISVRAVTARAGVSPTALYLHFADRDELMRAVCNRSFEELRSYLHAADEAHAGDPLAQMAAIGRAYLEFAEQRSAAYRIIFSMPAGKGDMEDRLGEPLTGEEDPGIGAFEILVGAVSRLASDEAAALETSIQLWAALHGFVTLRQAMPLFAWPDPDSFLGGLWRAHYGAGR
jgi:AcrR family transcriptional regulator